MWCPLKCHAYLSKTAVKGFLGGGGGGGGGGRAGVDMTICWTPYIILDVLHYPIVYDGQLDGVRI